jgi:regulator of sirC expression with transglutaminase-like and TPR domain
MMRKTLTTVAIAGVAAVAAGCMTAMGPFERGRAHHDSGQYLFAADEFSEAIRQDPTSAAAHVNRGVTRVRLGQLNAAIEDYNRAIQLEPGDPAIYFNRGNALVAAGQYGLAIEDFTRAVELSPESARAWFNRGTARSMAGHGEAAMLDWLHAIEIERDPWARAGMRRSAGLEPLPAVAAGPPAGQPTTGGTVAPAPPPGMATAAVPLPPPATVAATPPVATAASPATAQAIDARALATRAISRQLDGDHEGALQDLRAALAIEPDPARRATIESLLRSLETPR